MIEAIQPFGCGGLVRLPGPKGGVTQVMHYVSAEPLAGPEDRTSQEVAPTPDTLPNKPTNQAIRTHITSDKQHTTTATSVCIILLKVYS